MFALLIFVLMLPLPVMPAQGSGSIDGIVVAAGSTTPVPRAAVTVKTATGRQVATLTTSLDGRFSLSDIPSGEYLVMASQDGFVSNFRGFPVTVVSSRKTDFSLGMVRKGAISGRVVDWDGLPVVGSQVQALAFTPDARGRRVLSVIASTPTNDLGEYRIYWLPPGPYFINAEILTSRDASISRVENLSSLIHQPRLTTYFPNSLLATYFPSSVDAAGARQIDLRAGETFTGADVRLINMQKRSVSGVVSMVNSRGATAVALYPRNSDSGTRDVKTSADSTGSFKFTNVVPGSYVLMAEATSADGVKTFGRMPIDVDNRDVENVSVVLTPGFDLRIRLTIEGRSRRSDDPPLVVNLRPSIADTPFPSVERNGNDDLTMHHVMVGDYSLTVLTLTNSRNENGASVNGSLYMKAAQYGGMDVLASGLHIEGPPSSVLDIVMADGAGTLSGSVLDDRRQPASGVTVVLVPEPQLRGRKYLYKTATTDTAGKFEISGIAPGQYKAFSWEAAAPGEWQYPDFMASYEDRGQPIRIDATRRDPIPVQLIPPRY